MSIEHCSMLYINMWLIGNFQTLVTIIFINIFINAMLRTTVTLKTEVIAVKQLNQQKDDERKSFQRSRYILGWDCSGGNVPPFPCRDWLADQLELGMYRWVRASNNNLVPKLEILPRALHWPWMTLPPKRPPGWYTLQTQPGPDEADQRNSCPPQLNTPHAEI